MTSERLPDEAAQLGDRVTRACAGVAALVALVALAGWITGNPAAARLFLPQGTLMRVNTAIALLLLSVAALASLRPRGARLAMALYACVALLAGATAFESAANVSLGIDQLVLPSATSDDPSGRMAVNTALSLLLLALGGLFLAQRGRRWERFGAGALALAASIPLVALLGFALNAPPLTQPFGTTPMAFATALALSALVLAVAFAQPAGTLVGLLRESSRGASVARTIHLFGVGVVALTALVAVTLDAFASRLSEPYAWGSATLQVAAVGGAVLWMANRVQVADVAAKRELAERKAAEDSARQAHARLDAAFRSANVGIAIVDRAGRFVEVNGSYARIAGRSPEALRAMTLFDLTHPDDAAARRAAFEDLFEGRIPSFTLEAREVRPDGSWAWARASGSPVREDDQPPRLVLSVLEDVSERVEKESQLRRSEARLAKAEQLARLGSWELDVGTNELTWSDEIYRIFEIDPARFDPSHDSFLAAVHPDDRAAVEAAYRAHLERGRPYDFVHRLLFADGRVKHVHERCETTRDTRGTPLRSLGTVQDVTDATLAEAALRRNETRLRETQALSKVGGWEFDLTTQRVSWTEEVYRIHEVGPDFDPNDPLQDMTFYVGEHHALIRRAFDAACKEGTPYDLELLLQTAKGRTIWVRTLGRAEREDGRIVRVYGYIMDVTERKLAESEIRALNADLERRVAARTAELETANKELEAFAYSVSHDLRAPLRAIDGFSQALLEDYRDKLDAEGLDSLTRVRAASQRMGSLIDDMLHLSRVSRAQIHRESVDLSMLAQEIGAELAAAHPERDVAFHVDPGLVAVGDPPLVRVVLQNYLENAWKFTSKRAHAHVEVGSIPTPSGPAFFVRDDGAGYDPAYQDKLFGAFQRLHRAEEFPGNGIGLASVKRIVTRHGGRVWAEGKPDAGATFYFTLPEAPTLPPLPPARVQVTP